MSTHAATRNLFLLLALLAVGTACQSFTPAPTLEAPVEIVTPLPPPTRRPSPTPRPIASPTPIPTITLTPSSTHTPNPFRPTLAALDAPPMETIDPALLTQVASAEAPTLAPQTTLIGRSFEERVIVAHTLGTGPQKILLVGGIHGGFEVNTVQLMNEAIDHFEENPAEIAPGLTLVIVPALNPDGLTHGREPRARFNGNGVDLNRNWACDWSPNAEWRDQSVDPGSAPFSEPESAALADYILLNQPAAAVFYHSAANGVFAGACDGDNGSQVLGHVYGAASGYPSDSSFEFYEVTGDASSWVDGQGIPAITVELQTWSLSEWDRNYRGIMAVQCALAEQQISPASRQWAQTYCETL